MKAHCIFTMTQFVSTKHLCKAQPRVQHVYNHLQVHRDVNFPQQQHQHQTLSLSTQFHENKHNHTINLRFEDQNTRY